MYYILRKIKKFFKSINDLSNQLAKAGVHVHHYYNGVYVHLVDNKKKPYINTSDDRQRTIRKKNPRTKN